MRTILTHDGTWPWRGYESPAWRYPFPHGCKRGPSCISIFHFPPWQQEKRLDFASASHNKVEPLHLHMLFHGK